MVMETFYVLVGGSEVTQVHGFVKTESTVH